MFAMRGMVLAKASVSGLGHVASEALGCRENKHIPLYIMNHTKPLTVLAALAIAFLGQSTFAQNAGKSNQPEPPKGLPAVDKPAAKPETPNRSEVADAIKKLQDDFKQTRENFLDHQSELNRQLKNATKDDREKLRTEIKEKRKEFLELQKEARQEAKKRMDELKGKLKDHREVIDEAKDKAKETAKDRAKERKGGEQ